MKMHLYERLQFLEVEMRMVAFSKPSQCVQLSEFDLRNQRTTEREIRDLALLRCRARTMPLIGRVPEPSPVTEEEA